MGRLRGLGSRDRPPRMQKSRQGMSVSEETVAAYTAARAFLMGEWFGATLMVASFTLLYLFAFVAQRSPPLPVVLGVCLAMFLGGAFIFWRNHEYYVRLGFHWAKRWDTTAIVVAGAGAIFWLLFGLLALLSAFGVDVLGTQ